MLIVQEKAGATILVMVGLLAGAPAHAQRTVTGTVVDSASNKSLSGATLYVDRDLQDQVSDKNGGFTARIDGRETTLVFRRVGYVPRVVTLPEHPVPADTNIGPVRLRQAKTDADQLVIEAEELRLYPYLADFYRRRRNLRQGYFLTRDDVTRSSAREVSYAVRRTSGLQNLCLQTRQGTLDCGDARRATTYSGFRADQPSCAAEIWVDGERFQGTADDVRVETVVGVEAYTAAGTTPREFGTPACGLVAIWTTRVR